jgi:GDP-4-dehydro-6-deoxy-D-mannose reductase
MRILVTGATGFVGRHLADALLAAGGGELFGLSLHGGCELPPGTPARWLRLYDVDLCDGPRVEAVLWEVSPEQVYHLAGYADAGRSYEEAEAAWRGNLTATRSLYDAILRWGGRPRILAVSTGAVYGEPTEPDRPVDERTVLRPNSPYAASKAAADLAGYQYACCWGLDVVRVRPFNHVGPGQSPRYAVANFARQIAAIEQGRQPPVLRTGNLWTERDLTDVRDVVRAYLALMARGERGEVYNLGSGRTLPMRTYLDHLLALSSVPIRVETDPSLQRRVETTTVRVDASLLRRTTGWAPAYPLEQTLADTLADWRQRLAEGSAGA